LFGLGFGGASATKLAPWNAKPGGIGHPGCGAAFFLQNDGYAFGCIFRPMWPAVVIDEVSEGGDADTIQQSLDAREFGRNDKPPICSRAGSNNYFFPLCSLAVASPLVRLHGVTEFCLLALVALPRKKAHDSYCHLEPVREGGLGAWKAVLDYLNCIDDCVCAVTGVYGRGRVVVLHIVSGPMAFVHGSSQPWDANVEPDRLVGHQAGEVQLTRVGPTLLDLIAASNLN